MFNVDFDHPALQVICHDQYQHLVPKILEGLKSYNLTNHFILFSSGTSGDLKGYALSKQALLANAAAVNEHFNLTPQDVWALSLPIYHVGGLSVLARAKLLGNSVIDARHWDPVSWHHKIQTATITTLVPTQLYDLVKLKLRAPPNLRYAVIGGDLLSATLKAQALELGWPVIRTFGMSEVSSQLASSKNPLSDDLEILPIHEVKILNEKLLVKSPSLFTLEFVLGKTLQVTLAQELSTSDGFYISKDRVEIQGKNLKHLGRMGEEFKVAGHLVNLQQLRDQLASLLLQQGLYQQMEFALVDDSRKGKKLILLALKDPDPKVLAEISTLIHPVKIDEVKIIEAFDRTALGKLKQLNF